jgi:hypothetical protein
MGDIEDSILLRNVPGKWNSFEDSDYEKTSKFNYPKDGFINVNESGNFQQQTNQDSTRKNCTGVKGKK